MIKVDVLASGSSGNAYMIDNGRSRILLDCGIAWKQINIISGWKKFDICLVSHEHKDHCKALKDIIKLGVSTYIPQSFLDKSNFKSRNVYGLADRSVAVTQDWKIQAFGLHHDVETLGFQITERKTGDKLVYITDTMYCKYRFKGITHWMVECNNDKETLEESVAEGTLHPKLRNRIVSNHMSLETVKEMLLSNDLSKTQEIWLLHLSRMNSSGSRIKKEVQEVTGKAVYIA